MGEVLEELAEGQTVEDGCRQVRTLQGDVEPFGHPSHHRVRPVPAELQPLRLDHPRVGADPVIHRGSPGAGVHDGVDRRGEELARDPDLPVVTLEGNVGQETRGLGEQDERGDHRFRSPSDASGRR